MSSVFSLPGLTSELSCREECSSVSSVSSSVSSTVSTIATTTHCTRNAGNTQIVPSKPIDWDALRKTLFALVKSCDSSTVTLGSIRAQLEEITGLSLKKESSWIADNILEMWSQNQIELCKKNNPVYHPDLPPVCTVHSHCNMSSDECCEVTGETLEDEDFSVSTDDSPMSSMHNDNHNKKVSLPFSLEADTDDLQSLSSATDVPSLRESLPALETPTTLSCRSTSATTTGSSVVSGSFSCSSASTVISNTGMLSSLMKKRGRASSKTASEMAKNRPQQCPHCSKWFANPRSLGSHLKKKHSPEYPYKCDETGCKQAYAMKCELVWHKRVKHARQKYMCVICNLRTPYPYAMKRHMRDQHSIEIEHADSAQHVCIVPV